MGESFKFLGFTFTVPLLLTLNILEEPSKGLGTAVGFDAQEVRRNAKLMLITIIILFIRQPPL
jgi:hypothetical protein